MIEPSEILFVGIGKSSVLWYRCALPAMHLGADWVGVRGSPPAVQVMTGIVKNDTALPNYDDYKVIILQQVNGNKWLRQINALRERGIKVLYEIDDYLHGVRKAVDHDFRKQFTSERLRGYETCMRACDGIICSTEYIARRYARFNRNLYICQNGLDVERYGLTRPERSTINIGWAGATGHLKAMVPWLNGMLRVMRQYKDTCFISIGMPELADAINQALGTERAIGIPFIPVECYPAAMTMFDIALAPAGSSSWYRGKSDLRWLEASALGVPVIADPNVYPNIEPGRTGFWASGPDELSFLLRKLVEDAELRHRVGEEAREYVHRERTADIAARAWYEVCSAVVGGHESMNQLARS